MTDQKLNDADADLNRALVRHRQLCSALADLIETDTDLVIDGADVDGVSE